MSNLDPTRSRHELRDAAAPSLTSAFTLASANGRIQLWRYRRPGSGSARPVPGESARKQQARRRALDALAPAALPGLL
jgi:hypothetical protein